MLHRARRDCAYGSMARPANTDSYRQRWRTLHVGDQLSVIATGSRAGDSFDPSASAVAKTRERCCAPRMALRDLEVRPGLVIPGIELQESASRSSGPGGQNVNKTSTRVTLRWDVGASESLTEAQRHRIFERLASRLTLAGELLVHAQAHRTRPRNRELARARLAELVRDALRVQRKRVSTKPTTGSRRRVRDAKKRRSTIKIGRAKPGLED